MLVKDYQESGSVDSLADKRSSIESSWQVADAAAQTRTRVPGWKRVGFLVVNVWLVFHLFAIIICPASVNPSSPVLQFGFELVAPYLHFIYLDHGFHFFAPEPGPSTLVSYTLEFADGSKKKGRIPDRTIFPRLWYHRHFMLTEFLGNGPEDLQPLVERAFARNLCRETGAIRVALTKVVHVIPSVEEIQRGITLKDPSLYRETPLGTYTPQELKLPLQLKTETQNTPDAPAVISDATNTPKDSP